MKLMDLGKLLQKTVIETEKSKGINIRSKLKKNTISEF